MIGDAIPEGLYTHKQIDYADSIEEENLRDQFLHLLRSRDLGWREAKAFENKCNTLENIILDMRELYPELKIPNMKETAEKHGELPSYLKMKEERKND